jgi:triphosphoribosyl-dephospho-CoA synthase
MTYYEVGDFVARCAGLATLLEVSAYPKPGNVHRTHDFDDTLYEHFLASSISIMPIIQRLASKAHNIENENGDWSDLRIGNSILSATKEMLKWQKGGNVHLGVILLFTPIVAAAGAVYQGDMVDLKELNTKLKDVINGADPYDSVSIYKAINLSMSKKVLGTVKGLDVSEDSSKENILNNSLTPKKIFETCSGYDSICSEWITDYYITFNIGFPHLKKQLISQDLNSSTVNTFLHILALYPDTLIQRKSGKEKAREISQKARLVLEKGGASTERGRKMLFQLDYDLQKEKGSLNPGTTADLTAASLFLLTLSGWKP